MNNLVFGVIYILLILGLLVCGYFCLFVPKKNIRLKAFYRRGNITTKKRKTKAKKNKKVANATLERISTKKVYNPYAICRSMQRKYGWSEDKYNRCVEDIKAKEKES